MFTFQRRCSASRVRTNYKRGVSKVMELFKITFVLCYYLGLYPFRYRENQIKITKLGFLFMFVNVTVFLVLYALATVYRLHQGPLVSTKWHQFLPYWHFAQIFIVLYCLISAGVRSNVDFANYCMRICAPINGEYKISGLAAWYFILLFTLNVISYLWFNMLILRRFGTETTFVATFAVLHTDIVFVAFEAFVLFLLNAIEETLHGIELRLILVRSALCPTPTRNVVRRDQLFKVSKRPTIQQCREIRKLRILHHECTTVAEKLINKYKFLLLYAVGHDYVVMVSYSYFVTHTLYSYLSTKQPESMIFMSSAVIYIVSKVIRLWALCDADNQLNQQIRLFQYQCFVKPIKLTVAGLFNLDTNFLQSSVAAGLAYVVLMLQYSEDVGIPPDHSLNTTSTEDSTFVTASTPFYR